MLDKLWSQAWGHFFVELSRREVGWLATSSQHISLLASRRAVMIVSRVRLLASLFAVLTPLWIPIDIVTLPTPIWAGLAVARIAAAAAFSWVVVRYKGASHIEEAHRALFTTVVIPVLFVFATDFWLGRFDLSVLPAPVAASYGFLPFVLIVALAIFPLTALENLVCAGTVLATHFLTTWLRWPHLDLTQLAIEFWLLSLIGAGAVFAGMSQLAFMIALVREAIRDNLTGVFARHSAEELLALQFLIASRANAPLSVAFIDLDRFKEVNDTWGHEAGDRVLTTAADRIRNALRTGDMLARWGGEEFLLIMPNTSSIHARLAIHRVRSNGLGVRPDDKPVTASIGIAERIEEAASDWHALVERADARMYAAKAAGRDRVVATDLPPGETGAE